MHGFKFPNRFRGVPLPASLRDRNSAVAAIFRAALADAKLPDRFGLCGGMSAAAADFYWAGLTRPSADTPPVQGTPLYEYLHARQMDSLGDELLMVLKFWQWMNLPDTAEEGQSTASLTTAELPIITGRLRDKGLVPVGLVYVKYSRNGAAPNSRAGELWDNHQVLAYASTTTPDATVLRIYDPNYPNDDGVTITITTKDGASRCELRTGSGPVRPVRGIFAMPYTKVTPPGALTGRE
ncbi:MAG: hypothetical protein DYG92_11690 [Leptolyngbya sp. PLA1]|nr:hypothetical protein [Leptolyngbya sp. PLA1]